MSDSPELIDETRVRESTEMLWKNRMLILVSALAAGLIAALISLLLPPTYQAVATCIPVSSQSGLGGLSQLGLSVDDLGLPFGLSRNSSAVYPEVIRSRRTMVSLLRDKFRTSKGDSVVLLDYVEKGGSGAKRVDKAIKSLRSAITSGVDRRSGILSIRVELGDPVLAAAVANATADLLQQFMIATFSLQASENRRFIESRLVESERELRSAESSLRAFRENNLRIGNAPHLLLEQDRLTRSLREREEIYLTLLRQLELAKIQESRDVPIVNSLDLAEPPSVRSSPKRSLLTLSGIALGGMVSIAFVLYRNGA